MHVLIVINALWVEMKYSKNAFNAKEKKCR
jgi:hypothetical protein